MSRKLLWLGIVFPLALLAACASSPFFSPPSPPSGMPGADIAASITKHATSELSVLSWIGGLAAIVGIVALVITRGAMGMRAVVCGVLLVILNFAIANYLGWILVPVLVGTGAISLAWSYTMIRQILRKKKEVK